MKKVCLILTGSVATTKANDLIDILSVDYEITVIYTKSSEIFINQYELANNPQISAIYKDEISVSDIKNIEHITLSKLFDYFLIAPASYNYINSYSSGIASSFSLSMLAAADPKKIIIAPAMNTNMYLNPILTANITMLKNNGVNFIDPVEGILACKDVGIGKMESVFEIKNQLDLIAQLKKKPSVLITCGSSRLYLDPVRYLTNKSSGKFGIQIALEFLKAGYDVNLIHGVDVNIDILPLSIKTYAFETNQELQNYITTLMNTDQKAIIMAAAPIDYEYNALDQKIKADVLKLELNKGIDIIASVDRSKIIKFGFALETTDHIINGQRKLEKKQLDYILINDAKTMGSDLVYQPIIYAPHETTKYEQISKQMLAKEIVKKITNHRG